MLPMINTFKSRWRLFIAMSIVVLGVLLSVTINVAFASMPSNLSAPSAVFTVTTTNQSGAGSLRQAILDANANPGADTIAFNIPGPGVRTIIISSLPLPVITDPVTIDGTTQPGFAGTPVVELDGVNGASGDGLDIVAGNSTVRGLAIKRFAGDGIQLRTNGGNVIQGNFIGTDASGTVRQANNHFGVYIIDAPNNIIGGTTLAARNLVSGNNQSGVFIYEPGATGNVVQGNYIGTDVTGNIPIGNGGNGVITGASNTIGGTASGARNLISGNGMDGIHISRSGNVVQGNYIGTNADGTASLGNGSNGIRTDGTSNNTIGGTTFGARNLISGNTQTGIQIYSGSGATGNVVQGNYIGTNADGTAPIGNSTGISINSNYSQSPFSTLVGGTAVGARNLVSGNTWAGIAIGEDGLQGSLVQGNYIGIGADGTTALGNGSNGIVLVGSGNTTIGGTAVEAGNVIAFNGGDGVFVISDYVRKSILSNSIFSNTGLGIDLEPNGVTPNDPGDGDFGANDLQNFPVLTSATSSGNDTVVQGMLNSTSNTTFRLQFFANSTCDPSGNGEGQRFLGSIMVTTDGGGNTTFTATLPAQVPAGHFITSTATDPNGNTSEFSQCVPVVSSGGTPTTEPTTSTPTNTLPSATSTRTMTSVPTFTSTTTPTGTLPPTFTSSPTNIATHTSTAGPTNTTVSTNTPTIEPTDTATAISTSITTNTPTVTATATACSLEFDDVEQGSTFYEFVRCLACRGIVSGYADGTFRPNNLVTRGQLAKIVSNSAGFTESPDPQIFEDVPSGSTFYEWINRLTRRGYMSGSVCGGVGEPCVNGDRPYFRPGANATRGQTSKIVSNTAGYTEEPTEQTFEDVPPTHTFYREIQRLASRNIMGGYPCGGAGEPCTSGKPYFRPSNDVTRGQSAKIVANTFYPNCQVP